MKQYTLFKEGDRVEFLVNSDDKPIHDFQNLNHSSSRRVERGTVVKIRPSTTVGRRYHEFQVESDGSGLRWWWPQPEYSALNFYESTDFYIRLVEESADGKQGCGKEACRCDIKALWNFGHENNCAERKK
jgi:hypothetical protein